MRHRRTGWSEVGFELGELVDPSGVSAALEVGCEEGGDDLVGESLADDTGTDRQHVGVVVRAGHPCGVEAVAQRRVDAANLVGGELFALAAAAENDAEVGVAVADRPADAGTDLRVVDRLVECVPWSSTSWPCSSSIVTRCCFRS